MTTEQALLERGRLAWAQIYNTPCGVCSAYRRTRGRVITAAIKRQAGTELEELVALGDFLLAVHERHQAGLSIEVPA